MQRASAKKTPLSGAHLGSLIERDETPEAGQQASIDNVVTTPATKDTIREQLTQLSNLRTPNTEPRPERGEMHPKTLHQTTAKAPDSGLKLGFVDIPLEPRTTLASIQNTPSKSDIRQSIAPPMFEFKFGAESQLSNEARKLMNNVREEAARIKAQMQAEKAAQEQADGEADQMFTNAAGRKIAQPKAKSGRFSEVHMAEFKKMDSIANHASAYRTKAPGFAQPTSQSLKRSGSRAGLDDSERPRTAGKGTPGRVPPPFLGKQSSVSPFKSIPNASSDRIENAAPAKRARHSEFHDVSATRQMHEESQEVRPSTIPKPVSNSLLSPTKASLARFGDGKHMSSPNKASMIPRSNSIKSLQKAGDAAKPALETAGQDASSSPSKIPRSDSVKFGRPLPDVPKDHASVRFPTGPSVTLERLQSTKSAVPTAKQNGFTSRLPTFSGLRSILRSTRKPLPTQADISRPDTPKRPNTASVAESAKKVDFTPSVKSRYAVKLAAGSPSPAKLPHVTPGPKMPPVIYDPAAYVIDDDMDDMDDIGEEWEDAESEVDYPALPSAETEAEELDDPFTDKAKEHNRRESKEFKSIFTDLHHPSRASPSSTPTLTNTTVSKTNTATHDNLRPAAQSNVSRRPSTIRRVRSSGADGVQPFEDTIQTVPHGIPGKKRRINSIVDNDQNGLDDDAKENRRITVLPQVPGGWEDSEMPDEDEGEKRGGKRVKVFMNEEPALSSKTTDSKKPRPSMAREQAAKNAKERKGKGILSLSRLNMLSRPKQRG